MQLKAYQVKGLKQDRVEKCVLMKEINLTNQINAAPVTIHHRFCTNALLTNYPDFPDHAFYPA